MVVIMSTCEPKKTEVARADNRSAFPETAKVVDLFRQVFGADQVKLVYANEGGNEIGKKLPPAVSYVTLAQWFRGSELIRDELVRRAAKPLPPSIDGYARGRR